MPQFIHLADERMVSLICKNGITAAKIHGRDQKGVFATPVTPNHYLSHQWLRELKRRGIRTISAVQFHIADDAEILIGRYNKDHITATAAQAVKIFMEHETGLGLEVIIPESIPAKSITRTYTPKQISGWRYYPESHADDRKPCGCPYCQRGQINNRSLREAYEADAIQD
jgi:hypothetical protein